jgi:hypothetical protein
MTCELTPLRVTALKSGTLSAEERASLRAHLETDCESCLDQLAGAGGDELGAILFGRALSVTSEEAERVLESAGRRRFGLEWLGASFQPRRALIPATLLAGLLIWAVVPGTRIAEQREKGPSSAIAAELLIFKGAIEDGRPKLLGALTPGAPLESGQVLLFRYRISAPAYVYLLGQAGERKVPLYGSDAVASAGEHEISEAGSVLALDPTKLSLGRNAEIVLVASPKPLEQAAPSCDRCGVASVHVLLPAPGENR